MSTHTPQMDTATDEQAAIVTSDKKKLLVIAGAGTGKTKTVVWRILELIARGTDPGTIVCITFTNIAAAQLVARLSGEGVTLRFIGTLHAFALEQLSLHGAPLGYRRSPSVISEDDAAAQIRALASDMRFKSVSVEAVKRALGSTGGSNEAILAKAYRKRCRQNNTLCFDLILAEYETLLKEGHHRPWIEALVVDEYQDSGKRDAAIYDLISAPHDLRVGDPDQSMYRFRGGDVKHLLDFAKGAEVFHLTKNFRSGTRIIERANALVHGAPDNPHRLPMVCMRTRSTVPVQEDVYEDARHEAWSIAEQIKAAGLESREVAVLTRFNARAKLIADALRAEGINVAEKERIEKPKRIIAALRALELLADPDIDRTTTAWLYSVHSPGLDAEARSAGRSMTDTLLSRLGVLATMPLGEKLARMTLTPAEIVVVRNHWMGDPGTTATALDLAEEESRTHGVHVGTVHSYKGAEATLVFLAGWEDVTTPGNKQGADLAEERRIAYVGMTRARDALRVSWCKVCPDSSGFKTITGKASPFLA